MRAVFLGTPASAVPSLAALLGVSDITVVITRPDTAKGRSQRPSPPPVKLAAVEWGLAVTQPASRAELHDVIAGSGVDVGVVVAYGRKIPSGTLRLPVFGFVNVHFSLLPRWRGAAPVGWAVAAGDEYTGVSLMKLDEGLDTGPVIAAIETRIDAGETGGRLTARLAALGGSLLADALPAYTAGKRVPAPQLEAGATLAPSLSKEEARLDPGLGAERLLRAVRAFHPRPGAWLIADGERLKVLAAAPAEAAVAEGRIESVGGRAVLGTSSSNVELLVVQPAGGRPIAGTAWMNGRRGQPAVVEPGNVE